MQPWTCALAIVLVACGGPDTPSTRRPPSTRAFSCEPSTWSLNAEVPLRGRLAATGREVHVVDNDGDDVLLASVTDGVIVARWSPMKALGTVTTEEVALSPAPGAAGDPAIRLRAGFPVPATGDGELAIHARGPVTVDGWVPARVRGRLWTHTDAPDRAPSRWTRSHGDYVVRAAATTTAPIRARLHDAFVKIRGSNASWFEVTAGDDTILVDGFIERPPPQASPPEVHDGVEIDAPDATTVAEATCLFDAPNGAPAGMVIELVTLAPRAADVAGWQAVRVDTAWGARDYFFPAPPQPPQPPTLLPDDELRWPYDGERWNEPR